MTEELASDYILTVDYDSLFDRDTVEHLLRLAADHPEADAIAPLQMRRGSDVPLVSVPGEDGKPSRVLHLYELATNELVRAATAHFGLTLIKTAALKKMSHPWFLGVPNESGEWGDGRTDDDSYFWHKWAETGNSLYLAPHVVIGHGEFMAKWPSRVTMQAVYQNPSDFHKGGPPEGVWR